ncbi:MAG: hypothetical protein IV090_10045 [Candidatus Sericytochromatia bacterium]|nr:hypothetical protein [Candidatus Sericytochromatia bacterium]
MGDINSSFVKQQIQNLNQVKPQQTQNTEKKPVESSIGQTEFQARKAMFEKQTSREPELGQEIRGQVESGLNEISGEKLQKNFKLFESTFIGDAEKASSAEPPSFPEHPKQVQMPQHPHVEEIDLEEEQNDGKETEESPSLTVKEPSQPVSTEVGNAEMASSNEPPRLPQHPKQIEMPPHPKQVEEINLEEEQNGGEEEQTLEQTEQPKTEQPNRPVNANHPPSSPPVIHSGKENPLNVSVNPPKQPQQSEADVNEADEDEM